MPCKVGECGVPVPVGRPQETTELHEKEEDRLVAVERYVQRIERSLVTEQKRRVEMYTLLTQNLQTQVDALNHRTAAQFAALEPEVPKRLAEWHSRLEADERVCKLSCERTRRT